MAFCVHDVHFAGSDDATNVTPLLLRCWSRIGTQVGQLFRPKKALPSVAAARAARRDGLQPRVHCVPVPGDRRPHCNLLLAPGVHHAAKLARASGEGVEEPRLRPELVQVYLLCECWIDGLSRVL